MKNSHKILAITGILLVTALQANAGIISKFRGWTNNGWNNYGWGNNAYHHNCPCYNNGFHNGITRGPGHRHHGNGFFNNGAITGFTPPINGSMYPSFGNYHSPMYGRFDHFPNGMHTLNAPPQQVITDFNSNVGTKTGITILD